MASVLHPSEGRDDRSELPAPEFDTATREKIEAAADEKERARREPGLSWHDWLYFQAFKWWLVIGFVVVDGMLVAQWIEINAAWAIAPTLIVAAYLEFLLFMALWYRPDPETLRRRRRAPFRPTWYRPTEVGRWTPEATLRQRLPPDSYAPDAVDPEEFL